ncbi:hypothetical protein ACTM71_23870, partial [Citrobacter portucalensis]
MRLHSWHVHPLIVLTQLHFRHFPLQTVLKRLPLAALSVPYQQRSLPLRTAPSLSVPTLPHCPHPLHWPEHPALSVGHYRQQ